MGTYIGALMALAGSMRSGGVETAGRMWRDVGWWWWKGNRRRGTV